MIVTSKFLCLNLGEAGKQRALLGRFARVGGKRQQSALRDCLCERSIPAHLQRSICELLHRTDQALWRPDAQRFADMMLTRKVYRRRTALRSEEHTSELQSLTNLVCRLLLEK